VVQVSRAQALSMGSDVWVRTGVSCTNIWRLQAKHRPPEHPHQRHESQGHFDSGNPLAAYF